MDLTNSGRRELIKTLEKVALVSWPAPEVFEYHGWLFRYSPTLTYRRVRTAFAGFENVDLSSTELIEFTKEFYREKGITPMIHVTEVSHPIDLREELEKRGWVTELAADVLIKDVPHSSDELPSRSGHEILVVDTSDLDQLNKFLEVYREVFEKPASQHEEMIQFFRRLQSELKAHIILLQDEAARSIGTAVGVAHDGYFGIFGVAVKQEARGKGLGTYLMHYLEQLANKHGSELLYLQVTSTNSAKQMYFKLGYDHLYTYRYFMPPVH